MRKLSFYIISFISLWLFKCSSPPLTEVTSEPLFYYPNNIALFPNYNEDNSNSFIGYILNEGNIEDKEYKAQGEATLTMLKFIYDETTSSLTASKIAENSIKNPLKLGGIPKDIIIDTNLKLGYILTYNNPSNLFVIDLLSHKLKSFYWNKGSETLYSKLEIEGFAVSLAFIPLENEYSSKLFILDGENGQIFPYIVYKDNENIVISGGEEDKNFSLYKIDGKPKSLTPSLDGKFLFVTNEDGIFLSVINLTSEPPQLLNIDIKIPSKKVIINKDGNLAFILGSNSNKIILLDLTLYPPKLLENIEFDFCYFPLDLETVKEDDKEYIYILSESSIFSKISLPKLEEDKINKFILPELRCTIPCESLTCEKDTIEINLKMDENNVVIPTSQCPLFFDKEPFTEIKPAIDKIILTPCKTPSDSWTLTYNKVVEESGKIEGDYIVKGNFSGIQKKHLKEITPQEANSSDYGFYLTDNSEIKMRVISGIDKNTNKSTTSHGDKILFSTYRGFEQIQVGNSGNDMGIYSKFNLGFIIDKVSNSLYCINLKNMSIIEITY